MTRENLKYMTSFEVIKYEDHYIELVEEHPCQNKQQLCRREGHVIRETECVNKNIAGRTGAEYHQENREKDNENARRWYQENKERRLQEMSAWYQKNKEHINRPVECNVCKCTVSSRGLSEHNKTKKHLNALQVSNLCVSPALSSEGSTSSSEMASSKRT